METINISDDQLAVLNLKGYTSVQDFLDGETKAGVAEIVQTREQAVGQAFEAASPEVQAKVVDELNIEADTAAALTAEPIKIETPVETTPVDETVDVSSDIQP